MKIEISYISSSNSLHWLLNIDKFKGVAIKTEYVHVCIKGVQYNLQICNKYTLFDGLAYNTCGYFASCVVFSEPRRGEEKYEQ